MPALPADILRASRQAKIVTREDASFLEVFPGARDGAEDPDPGYFENAVDAAAALALKAALIGRHARRFAVTGAGDMVFDPVDGIPVPELVDAEHEVSASCLLARVELDLENERFGFEVLA